MHNSIVFGAECSCGQRVTCLQIAPTVNFVLSAGKPPTWVWRDRDLKRDDALADMEAARDQLDAAIARMKQ